MNRYRFFDLCIESDRILPGLAECPDQAPDWRVGLADAPIESEGFNWVHTWKAPDGQAIMAAASRGQDYLLEFSELARFSLDFGCRRIRMQPLAGCTDITLAHLLLDQVLPRAVCHEGRPVVHASAVIMHDGRAIAFAGPSGRGKSTLAAAFHRAGYPLMTDDCLLLQQQGEGILAIPAYPSLRLWPDTLEAMYGDATGALSDMAHYTDKKQLQVGRMGQPAPGQWPMLAALFLLSGPAEEPATDDIRIERAGGTAALIALIDSMFALDVVNRDAVKRNFALVGQIAGQIPMLNLSYPQDYRVLPQLVARIAGHDPAAFEGRGVKSK